MVRRSQGGQREREQQRRALRAEHEVAPIHAVRQHAGGKRQDEAGAEHERRDNAKQPDRARQVVDEIAQSHLLHKGSHEGDKLGGPVAPEPRMVEGSPAFTEAQQIPHAFTSTTTRPRIRPRTISSQISGTSASPTTRVIRSRASAGRSVTSRRQAALRRSTGVVTDSTPTSTTPRRMKG